MVRVTTVSKQICLLVVDDCENKLPFYMQKRGVKIRHHHDIMFNIIVFSTLVVNPPLFIYVHSVQHGKKHKNFFCVSEMRTWHMIQLLVQEVVKCKQRVM